MKENNGAAVVFWGPHSVSTEQFARRLNATCYMIHYLSWKRPWIAPLKYPPMWLKTWWVLLKQRPSKVLVINTPVFAPLSVYLYCVLAGIPFAMNVHGHTLGGRRWGWSRPIQQFLSKRAAVSLVGTTEYQQIFNTWGARVLFLEDPPLEIPAKSQGVKTAPSQFRVTVVSTFAGDEPLDLIIQAARRLPDVCFYITGDTTLASQEFLDSAPENVKFPGYLKGNSWWDLLFSSNAIMTLTTNPYSLVSGGTEGMYIGKPLILSRQPALTEYFTKGTVFIDHTVDSIIDGVHQARERESILSQESKELAAEKRSNWECAFQEFEEILGEACE
jgi:glycosyltransferase involved in cell wall biosynthesis